MKFWELGYWWRHRWIRWGILTGLWCNFFDLSGHWFYDVVKNTLVAPNFLYGTPYNFVQYLLLVAFAGYLIPCVPSLCRAWLKLPIPLFVRILVGFVLVVEITTVVIRREKYPFTHFSMYAYVSLDRPERTISRRTIYMIESDGEWKHINIMREGDILFHEYLFLGPKTAALIKWYHSRPFCEKYFTRRIHKKGYSPIHRGRLVLDWESGEVTTEPLGPVGE